MNAEARYGRVALTGAAVFILVALLGLSAASWLYALGGAGMMMEPAGDLEGVSLFVVTWTLMLVAMMFPSVAPVVLVYSARARHLSPSWPALTATFVAGYLLVWSLLGIAAYVVMAVFRSAAAALPLNLNGALPIGALIALGGMYQLTPLKNTCLSHCRTPLHWMLRGLRPGWLGALWMGLGEGVFCVGCCVGLMAVLFAVGLASVPWMGVVAAVIFVEKVLAPTASAARLVAFGLIVLGALVAVSPTVAAIVLGPS